MKMQSAFPTANGSQVLFILYYERYFQKIAGNICVQLNVTAIAFLSLSIKEEIFIFYCRAFYVCALTEYLSKITCVVYYTCLGRYIVINL